MSRLLAFLGRHWLFVLCLASILALFGSVAFLTVIAALLVGWLLRHYHAVDFGDLFERIYRFTGARVQFHAAFLATVGLLIRSVLGYSAMGVMWAVFLYCLASPQP